MRLPPRVALQVLVAVLIATPVHAQAPADTASPTADTAVLTIRGAPIAVLRSPLGALTPSERAAAATRRIETLAQRGISDSVVVVRVPEGRLLRVADTPVLTITPADVEPGSGRSLQEEADRAAARLGLALRAEAQMRSLPQILRAIALAIIATILFALVLRGLRWSRRVLLGRMRQLQLPEIPRLPLAGDIFRQHLAGTLRRLAEFAIWATGLMAAYLWLTYVLTRFAVSRPWGEALGGFLLSTVLGLIVGALQAVPGLITVAIILVMTRLLARVVGALFDAIEGGDIEVPWIHPETANPTRRIVIALLWLFAIIVSYPYLPGSGSDVFKGVSVFVGVIISIGSSGLVNQAMSGLAIMYSRALKPGDFVRIGETEGTVTALGMLATKVRTTKLEEVTIPNTVALATTTKNYSRLSEGQGVVLYTTVTIGYDTPWRQVHALLTMAADRTDGVRRAPRPFVLQIALSDFYVEYQLNVYLDVPEDRNRILAALHASIQDCFNEFGVQIMSPHYEEDPRAPKLVPPERRAPPPAAEPAHPGS